jgi:hypothetical protein
METPRCGGEDKLMANRTLIVAGVIAVAVLGTGGYVGYASMQKKKQQRQVKELVVDTTDKLRQVLVAKSAPDLAGALDANLSATKAPRDPKLADAAEHYILGAREIARRRAAADRYSRQAAASRQALAAHMRGAAYRSQPWMDQALALKKRVEDDHFNLGVELKALDELLFSMSDAEQRLAPHVGREILIEESLFAATRKQTQDDLRRSADDLERARHLNLR